MPEFIPDIFADKERIRQVFTNLISNALKFTPSGGKIEILARIAGKHPEFLVVDVKDTGIGISSEYLSKIFDKFQQARDARQKAIKAKGTGLGLFIIKNIVELHGGKVSITSEVGHGTTFTLTLPVHKR